jgi:hypothetical protein
MDREDLMKPLWRNLKEDLKKGTLNVISILKIV